MILSEFHAGLQKRLKGPPFSKALKILLIDDNLDDVFFVRMALDKISVECVVQHSESGVEAFEYLQTISSDQWPDLILLDISMSGLDGFEVLRLLKENPQTVGIPVVIHTGSSSDEDKKRAISLGVSHFVTKAANCSEIVKKVCLFKDSVGPRNDSDSAALQSARSKATRENRGNKSNVP
jgi:CheY-like chemotaxis protein